MQASGPTERTGHAFCRSREASGKVRAMAAEQKRTDGRVPVAANRKARFEFEVLETVEAGLVLLGSEVKSLRRGRVSLDEAFARLDGEELFLVGAHIPEYPHASLRNHEPTRKRKLLLRRGQIRRWRTRAMQKGFTLVPLELYFSPRGLAKLTLALCRGKKVHDKREALRTRAARREISEG
jgi:SsrA-binding protein